MGTKYKYAHLSEPDPEVAPLLPELTQLFNETWKLPIKEVRARRASQKLQLSPDVPTELDTAHHKVPVSDGSEIEIRVYNPKNSSKNKLPLFFVTHGGGWVAGNHDIEEGMSRSVCVKCEMLVVSVNYRLAPEFPFPTAINDCFEVLKWTIANAELFNIDPAKVIIGGGSSGGNIVPCWEMALALRSRDEDLANIVGQVLNIPVICHPKYFPKDKYEYHSFFQNADGAMLNSKRMLWFWEDLYLPNGEPNPYAHPLLAQSLANLPPALIQIAGADPLRDEGFAYADALKSAGNDVTVKVYPGLPHGFPLLPHLTSTSKFQLAIVDWINSLN